MKLGESLYRKIRIINIFRIKLNIELDVITDDLYRLIIKQVWTNVESYRLRINI